MSEIHAIILAAGQGKRMQSPLPKVLHLVGGSPMVLYALKAVETLKCRQAVLVVPQDGQLIREAVSASLVEGIPVRFAVQHPPRGTGDAVRCALEQGELGERGTVIVMNGDLPLLTAATLQKLINAHQSAGAGLTLLTGHKDDPFGFGRILRDSKGTVTGIVEEKDADPAQKTIREVNVGLYVFDLKFLKQGVYELKTANRQTEYYLTDLVSLALRHGQTIQTLPLDDVGESLGVNSRAELALVNREFYARQRRCLTEKGVLLLGEEIFVDAASQLEAGVTLESPCYVRGESVLEADVMVETGCVIKSSRIGQGSHLKAHCYVDSATVDRDCQIGPFAHLRPQTVLAENVKIGNFVETKKTVIGKGSKANHLSYLGDATLGRNVNVGAGTITCNYDGVNKFPTVLEDGVFIGSDTQLVAPVKVGQGAYVGAGTTVTKDVSAYSLVISRVPQKEIPDWAKNKHKAKKV